MDIFNTDGNVTLQLKMRIWETEARGQFDIQTQYDSPRRRGGAILDSSATDELVTWSRGLEEQWNAGDTAVTLTWPVCRYMRKRKC